MDNNKEYIYPVIIFCIGFFIFPLRLIEFFVYLPGDLGDTRLNLYFLEHNFQFIIGNIKSYWDAPFFYPDNRVLTYSDNLIGSSPFYIVFRLFFDKYLSYQLWFLVMFLLNYFASFYVLRRLNISIYSSSLGAFIFTFSISVFTHIGHLQLLPKFTVPFAFFYFYLFLKDLRLIHLSKSIFFTVYTFFCAIYLGYFLCVILVLLLLVFAFEFVQTERKIEFEASKMSYSLFIILISISAIIFLMLPYYERSKYLNSYNPEYLMGFVPTITTYFSVHPNIFTWNFLNDYFSTNHINLELPTFIGVVPLILVMLSIYVNNRNITVFNTCLIAIILLYIKIDTFSFYPFMTKIIPGLEAIRVPARHIQVTLIVISIIVSKMIDSILANNYLMQNNKKISNIFKVVMILLLCLDQRIHSFENMRFNAVEDDKNLKNLKKNVLSRLKETKVNHKEAILLITDSREHWAWRIHIDAMLVSQELNLKATVNGYSGYNRAEINEFLNKPTLENAQKWLSLFAKNTDKDANIVVLDFAEIQY